MFTPLPDKPDHPCTRAGNARALGAERTFERLREQNRGGPRFRFMDGPITANNPVGVHHGVGPRR